MSSSFRLELNKYIEQLDVKADFVLDVGGSQEPIRKRVRSWDVKEYIIADIPQPHKDSPAPDLVLDLNYGYGGVNKDVHGYAGMADVIFCLEVFDYVYNPLNATILLQNLLKRGGRLIVSYPTIYPHHQPIEDDALRYMEGGIRKLADRAKLKIVDITPRRPESILFDQFIRAERMRAAKHFDHNVTGYIVEYTK